MNPMLTEILRWQNHLWATIISSRWSNWAKRLMERFGLEHPREAGTKMILRMPYLFVNQNSLEQSSSLKIVRNVFPKIKLAIAPILQKIAGKETNALTQNRILQAAGRTPQKADSHSYQDERTVYHFSRTQNQIIPENQPTDNVAGGEKSNIINQVLAIFQLSEFHKRLWMANQELSIHKNQRTLRRLTQNAQRVDAQKFQSVSLKLRKQPSLKAIGQENSELRHDRNPNNHSTIHKDFGKPKINIEQLTDQVIHRIDRKMIAYKERMGKLF